MRKLARVFFEDRLRGLGRWRIKKNDCCHVFTERLCDAGELLRQHPHTDAGMASREAEFHQLSGPPFHVFRGGAVIKNDKSVRAFESNTGQLQPCFDTVLLADDHIQPRVSLTKPVQRSVIGEGRADQHNVIKLLNGPWSWFTRNWVLPELVGPTISALNGIFPGSISILHRR